MKSYLITMLALVCLSGCATADKLSKPKGQWVNLNSATFIPPDTTVYMGNTKPVPTVGVTRPMTSTQAPTTTMKSPTTPIQ